MPILFKPKFNKGFTLIELLVVISIIALLSVIGLTAFSGVQKSARDAKRRADLNAIATALEIYKVKKGTYPNTNGTVMSTASNPWIPGLDSNYMTSVPVDPINTGTAPWGGGFTYGYYTATQGSFIGGTYFEVVAHLENPNPADLRTKCVFPSGDSEGSTNSGAARIGIDNLYICSQQ